MYYTNRTGGTVKNRTLASSKVVATDFVKEQLGSTVTAESHPKRFNSLHAILEQFRTSKSED